MTSISDFDLKHFKKCTLVDIEKCLTPSAWPPGTTHLYLVATGYNGVCKWMTEGEAILNLGPIKFNLRKTVLEGGTITEAQVEEYKMVYKITAKDMERSAKAWPKIVGGRLVYKKMLWTQNHDMVDWKRT